jgi:AcrR family transcriptional regulator
MTRDKILEAAALEIERNGLTQFRVKRVASEANISIALLYSYFEDREDLIAATVVYRFRQVLVGLAQIFTTPLYGVKTADELRAALKVMITDAQLPFRTEARILRIESMSFAGHNPTASAGIAAAKREASDLIME